MRLTDVQVREIAQLEQSHGAMRRDTDSAIAEALQSEIEGAVLVTCPGCDVGYVIEPTGETWEIIGVMEIPNE